VFSASSAVRAECGAGAWTGPGQRLHREDIHGKQPGSGRILNPAVIIAPSIEPVPAALNRSLWRAAVYPYVGPGLRGCDMPRGVRGESGQPAPRNGSKRLDPPGWPHRRRRTASVDTPTGSPPRLRVSAEQHARSSRSRPSVTS